MNVPAHRATVGAHATAAACQRAAQSAAPTVSTPSPAGATPLAMELLRSPAKQEADVGRTLLKVLALDSDVAAELKAAKIRL